VPGRHLARRQLRTLAQCVVEVRGDQNSHATAIPSDVLTDQEVTLQHFLKFDDADLSANRDGVLGPGQRPRLVWSGIWRVVLGTALLFGSLAVAVGLLDTSIVAVFGLLVAGGGLALTWIGFAFLVDAIDGRVAYVTAPLRSRVVRGKTTTYYADCGPVSKLINSRAYEGLPRGLTCHLYYAPGSRSLLSIEPAADGEPKPAHPFGPDSAHVWDRLRVSWVAVTVGVLGILIAAHGFQVAHPAHPVPVEGTVASYDETHGRSTHRYLYLQGDPDSYTPYAEDSYSPPMPAFATLTGRNVVLYVDQGTRDVLAINDGEQLHAADWYLNPDHEKTFDTVLAATAGVISLLAVAGGVAGIVLGPRIAAATRRTPPLSQSAPTDALYASTPEYSMPALYAPPSVRPWHASWVIVPVLTLAGAAFGLLISLTTHA
jgi:hypothetical protein